VVAFFSAHLRYSGGVSPGALLPLVLSLVAVPACGTAAEGASDTSFADTVAAEPDGASALDATGDSRADLDGDGIDAADTIDAAEPSGAADAIDAAGAPDAIDAADALPETNDTSGTDAGATIAERCFPGIDPAELAGPQYDPYAPVVGSHCFGTDHQEIEGVEQVVFFGDSVTVGTPNPAHLLSIDNAHFYRNLLADYLADRFALERGDDLSWGFWKAYDYFSGKGAKQDSGDFLHCAKWGARTDDFLEGSAQIADCLPGGSAKRTLVVFTMGGNDIAAITKKGAEASEAEVAAGYPEARALADEAVAHLEAAVAWLKDPANFPNGSFVVFANPFEFTDATGKTDACSPQTKLDIPGIGEIDLAELAIPVAGLAGFGEWADPAAQKDIVVHLLEDYLRIAVAHRADLVFMLEHFCGHGYVAAGAHADPDNACYLGPDAALWFDETCIHPSEAGHRAIFEMFRAVIEE
jgi:lysophospholipase L1-like esterase